MKCIGLTIQTFVLLALVIGCERQEKQFVLEAQTVFGLMKMVEWYEAEHPSIPITNLAQVFSGLERDYPHKWHRQFAAYGEYAGFTNSLYEKYVFFPHGTTNSRFPGGLLFMNAAPYPGPNGKLERTVVSKDSGTYHRRTPPDEDLMEWLKESGIAVPKPPIGPPPPPAPIEEPTPLSTKISRLFMRAADFAGISEHWLLLRNTTFAAGSAALILLGAYLWSSRFRRRS